MYPSIGNHDTGETEDHDDRDQVMDNFYLRERMATEEAAAGRRSSRACSTVSGRRDIEFVCIDTSKEDLFAASGCSSIRSTEFIEPSVPGGPARPQVADSVLPPSAVQRRPAPPQHRWHGEPVPLFARSGVRVCSAATSTTFSTRMTTGSLLRLGRSRQGEAGGARRIETALTKSWAACHFLLVTIKGREMTVRAIGERRASAIVEIPRLTPSGETVQGPMVVSSL